MKPFSPKEGRGNPPPVPPSPPWATDKAGMSYGRFLQTLRPSDEAAIQGQYEEFIAQREREMAKRREGRGGKEAEVDGFIISDEDA